MQESRVPSTIGTIRTPSCRCLLGTKVSHVPGKWPAIDLQAGWDRISKSGIDLDPPTPYSQYLGCGQQAYDVPRTSLTKRMSTIRLMLPAHSDKSYHTAKQVRGIRHDML
eukprot:5422375-Pyramimonas_sp.AAC.1